MSEFHSLFSILIEVDNPTGYLARVAVAALFLDKDSVVIWSNTFRKSKSATLVVAPLPLISAIQLYAFVMSLRA